MIDIPPFEKEKSKNSDQKLFPLEFESLYTYDQFILLWKQNLKRIRLKLEKIRNQSQNHFLNQLIEIFITGPNHPDYHVFTLYDELWDQSPIYGTPPNEKIHTENSLEETNQLLLSVTGPLNFSLETDQETFKRSLQKHKVSFDHRTYQNSHSYFIPSQLPRVELRVCFTKEGWYKTPTQVDLAVNYEKY